MTEFTFADRTNWRQEPNALTKVLEDLRAKHVPVLDLTVSNPTQEGFQYPAGTVPALNDSHNLSYTPEAFGMAHAREAVAAYYASRNRGIDVANVMLTASTSEAYAFLLRLLVNPGERVLIPRPSYPLFQFLLEINDVAFDYYPLVYRGQWVLDREALAQQVDDKTKAIILVNPNNPTGSYLSSGDLEFLNQLCQQHHMSLIADEVFVDYAWGVQTMVSCLGNQAALTFVLGGLSKAAALPQMKCAWVLASGPKSLVAMSMERLAIISDTYLSVNTPAQNALAYWLSSVPAMQQQIKSRVQDNWQWLMQHLNPQVQLLAAQGGWYATLRIPAVKSEEEWVLEFLEQDHVLVHPGYFFDFDHEAYIVLSLLSPAGDFRDGCTRILNRVGAC